MPEGSSFDDWLLGTSGFNPLKVSGWLCWYKPRDRIDLGNINADKEAYTGLG